MEFRVSLICSMVALLVLIANCVWNPPSMRILTSDPCVINKEVIQHQLPRSYEANFSSHNRTCNGVPLTVHSSNGASLDLTVSDSFERPVYDLITFNDELLVLELRLRELVGVVDFFVINEQPKTSSGMPKPLYYRMHKALFAEFNSKIIVVNETISDELNNSWEREHAGRVLSLNAVMKIAPPNALIIFADVDEIPSCWTVFVLKHSPAFPTSTFVHLSMPYFYYSLRWRGERPFSNVKAFLGMYLEEYADPADLFFDMNTQHYVLPDSGWHCSYCMSVVGVVSKLISFAHTEYSRQPYTNPDHILECMRGGEDLFMRQTHQYILNRDDNRVPFAVTSMPERFGSFMPQIDGNGRVIV